MAAEKKLPDVQFLLVSHDWTRADRKQRKSWKGDQEMWPQMQSSTLPNVNENLLMNYEQDVQSMVHR